MRALIYGAAIISALTTAPALAGDVRQFEIQNLRLGMTVAEIKEAGKKAGLGEFRETRSPSFEQAVAMAQRKNIPAGSYGGVQTMQSKAGGASVRVGLIQTPNGSRAARITYSYLDTSLSREKLRADIVRQYGAPDAQRDLEWVWGDTAMFFNARKSAYLELRFDPASAGVEKPIAILTLADPAMERESRDAIQTAVQK